MPQYNIDIAFIKVKDSVYTKIDSSQVLDIEIAMLPKTCTAVISYLNRIHRKPIKNK